MAETQGFPQLEARLRAIGSTNATEGLMRKAALAVRGRMVLNEAAMGARKTGTTAASIQPADITATTAKLVGSPVNVWLDTGTGLHGPLHRRITPKAAKVLRWYGGPSGSLRLSGKPRKGTAGAGAGPIFARSTVGMVGRPFIARSVQEASKQVGSDVGAEIVTAWNGAA